MGRVSAPLAASARADRSSLPAELKPGQTPTPQRPLGGGQHNMALDRDAAWYAGPVARSIADTIVSFQTQAAGWSENQNRAGPRRVPGNAAPTMPGRWTPDLFNFDASEGRYRTFVGTLDNDATWTECAFWRKSPRPCESMRAIVIASFVKGVRYLFAA